MSDDDHYDPKTGKPVTHASDRCDRCRSAPAYRSALFGFALLCRHCWWSLNIRGNP